MATVERAAIRDCAEELTTWIGQDRELAVLALEELSKSFAEKDGRAFQQASVSLQACALLFKGE